tara:strand:- start:87 stop:605 length:519 start_codon:yes stop_codon:yes gene_type:complete
VSAERASSGDGIAHRAALRSPVDVNITSYTVPGTGGGGIDPKTSTDFGVFGSALDVSRAFFVRYYTKLQCLKEERWRGECTVEDEQEHREQMERGVKGAGRGGVDPKDSVQEAHGYQFMFAHACHPHLLVHHIVVCSIEAVIIFFAIGTVSMFLLIHYPLCGRSPYFGYTRH